MLSIIILAAGQGKRMCSSTAKVLHKLAGKPLLQYVIETAAALNPHAAFVVHGYESDKIVEEFKHRNLHWVQQADQLGTAHAVEQALPAIDQQSRVLILSGDVPLIEAATLQKLIDETASDQLGLLTMHVPDPSGLGRVIRDPDNKVISVIEDKDATLEQQRVKETYSGVMLVSASLLKAWLPQLKNDNAQREYYLTDLIHQAVRDGVKIATVEAPCIEEVQGVNDRVQLALLERYLQRKQAQQLMLKGVSLLDPHRFDLRGTLEAASDVTIDIDVVIEGKVKIGHGSSIGPYVFLRDVTLGAHVEIRGHCVIEGAVIADGCKIGPFARIRPGTQLAPDVIIGNFVELKKSSIGQETKISHLSYVGDATVGRHVNIGAGTITCNYDGANKHPTIIEDHVFVGSNVSLVAPIILGEESTIGAGSTISHEAPAHALTLSRAEQKTKHKWKRPKEQA